MRVIHLIAAVSLPVLVKEESLWECLWTPDLPFAKIGDMSEEPRVGSLEKDIQGYI